MEEITLYIFDVDGTLVETKSGDTFRKTADDWRWLPGRVQHLQDLSAHTHIAFASNQAGVAFPWSKFTDLEISNEMKIMAEATNAVTWRCCFTTPNEKALPQYHNPNDPNRKPGPGMLLDIMHYLDTDKEHTLFVGDRPEDEQAAKAAGVRFQWAKDYFHEQARETEKALFALYQQFQKLAELAEGRLIQLHLKAEGEGYINFTALTGSVTWEHLEEAAAKVEAEIKDSQLHLEERRAAMAEADEFDPFLDSDDLP